jgi:hypothetical protein
MSTKQEINFMLAPALNKEKFRFKYLPDYARYLLKNNLPEFTLVGIRFCRDEDLPLLRPFAKMTEEELTALCMDSNRQMLEALAANKIADHITVNVNKWIANALGIIDQNAITAEDLTLAFYIRRKAFGYFLDGFTKNVVEQKFIIGEVDVYTTQEELISYNIYLKLQQERFSRAETDIDLYRNLLLEAQQLGGLGSFMINLKDQSRNVFTDEYKRIFEMDGLTTFDGFLKYVHPADRKLLLAGIDQAYTEGGPYEVEYRYKRTKEKRIWSKGVIISDKGKPVYIRGVVKDISPEKTKGKRRIN